MEKKVKEVEEKKFADKRAKENMREAAKMYQETKMLEARRKMRKLRKGSELRDTVQWEEEDTRDPALVIVREQVLEEEVEVVQCDTCTRARIDKALK